MFVGVYVCQSVSLSLFTITPKLMNTALFKFLCG